MKTHVFLLVITLTLLISGCAPRLELSQLGADTPTITTRKTSTPVQLPPTWTPAPTSSFTPSPIPPATSTWTPVPSPTPTDPAGIIITENLKRGDYPEILTSLVFVREDSGRLSLYTLKEGITEPIQTLWFEDDIIFPQWSPNGNQLAYLRTADYKDYQEREVPVDLYALIDEVQIHLNESQRMYITDLAWSPDSQLIAFSGQVLDSVGYVQSGKDIYQAKILTKKLTQVIKSDVDHVGCSSPSWDPDSAELVARCQRGTSIGLAIANSDGSNSWYRYMWTFDFVKWSSLGGTIMIIGDGDKFIAVDAQSFYQRDPDGDLNELDIYQYLGSLDVQKKNLIGYGLAPGQYARFLIQSNDMIQIIDHDLDRILKLQGDFKGLDGQFSWGPYGFQVAIVYFDGNDTEIGVIDFARSSFYPLTNNQVDDLMPAWQPLSR